MPVYSFASAPQPLCLQTDKGIRREMTKSNVKSDAIIYVQVTIIRLKLFQPAAGTETGTARLADLRLAK